jgi:hypothetical protein
MAERRFLGAMFMAVDGIMGLLCGLCTCVSLAGEMDQFRVLSLIVGGVPTVIGVALFLRGRSIYREGLRKFVP